MAERRPHLRLTLLALTTVGCLSVASCSSSSGSDGSAATDGTTTTEGSAAPDASAAPLERYADYETVNYDDPSHWVCRPDVDDICDTNLDATVVEADGTLTVEPFEAAEDPKVDCFYVYPTISRDQTTFSDWQASDDEEGFVTLNQAARLQSECRLFAPVYRQTTLAGLAGLIGGGEAPSDEEGDPFADVLDAFKTYMAEDNDGRGFVLIGHSQGTGMLSQLIQTEIDPNDDVRSHLVGAYLAGGAVAVPEGEVVGGSFDQVPLCTTEAETGCAYTWSTFRSTAPPPDGAFFGVVRGGDGVAGCVNPAGVDGEPADLDAYFPATPGASILTSLGTTPTEDSWVEGATVETPYVRLPGLVSGQCRSADGVNWLEATVQPSPDGPRADDVAGDLTPEWGLHLVDVNLVMGDVVSEVGAQADAYAG